jgi:transketolase
MKLINTVLKFSYENKCSHIPSALSMLDYINFLFKNKIVVPFRDKIVLGKPFGSQAYYIVWKECGYLSDINSLSVGVKHSEIDFVDYSEETMGNACGVAIGIALSHPNKRVWVNLTDASLQMGSTLEALQYIGQKQLSNIFCTVDNNNCQVTGKTSDIISVTPVIEMAKHYGWNVIEVDGHDENQMSKYLDNITSSQPTLVNFLTQKGHGVHYMTSNPVEWHYKLLENYEI